MTGKLRTSPSAWLTALNCFLTTRLVTMPGGGDPAIVDILVSSSTPKSRCNPPSKCPPVRSARLCARLNPNRHAAADLKVFNFFLRTFNRTCSSLESNSSFICVSTGRPGPGPSSARRACRPFKSNPAFLPATSQLESTATIGTTKWRDSYNASPGTSKKGPMYTQRRWRSGSTPSLEPACVFKKLGR
ncbi:hypothetical protein FN846DRAFT_443028 [Sphaerosporella brunnea]|uniref:Uncharacterized protein n=1 Tax=Sphaerosporella brunnea TaxID=1250544 RepID=A0A5J5EHE6_9PEZI|nr:hypothetical protein FN846DRAFT_443028 [Sphaerosporella brunnea]